MDIPVIQVEMSQEEMCEILQEREWWLFCPKKPEEREKPEEEEPVKEPEPTLKMML